MGLVFSISNLFITKTTLANNWRRKKNTFLQLFGFMYLILNWWNQEVNNSLICIYLCNHGQSKEKHEDDQKSCEFLTSWSQIGCPIVNHSSNQGFSTAELGINSKDQKHEEKQQSPQNWRIQFWHHLKNRNFWEIRIFQMFGSVNFESIFKST